MVYSIRGADGSLYYPSELRRYIWQHWAEKDEKVYCKRWDEWSDKDEDEVLESTNGYAMGTLADYPQKYFETFKSYDPKPGAFVLTDQTREHSFVGSGESVLDELGKYASSHAKPASERSALEETIARDGIDTIEVLVVLPKEEEDMDTASLEEMLIQGSHPDYNEFTNFFPGDTLSMQIRIGPKGNEVKIKNKTRVGRNKNFASIAEAAAGTVEDEPWYWSMAAKFKDNVFEVAVGDYGHFWEGVTEWREIRVQQGSCGINFRYWDWMTDNPKNSDFWLTGNLTIYPGSDSHGDSEAPSAMMIVNNTRKLYKSYSRPYYACLDAGILAEDLSRLLKEHKGEPFTLSSAEMSKLKRAMFRTMYTELKSNKNDSRRSWWFMKNHEERWFQ